MYDLLGIIRSLQTKHLKIFTANINGIERGLSGKLKENNGKGFISRNKSEIKLKAIIDSYEGPLPYRTGKRSELFALMGYRSTQLRESGIL